jgi:Zn-dependent peptidase ImmA (M78 family)/DNA-binding XRE family transcriptional regulator
MPWAISWMGELAEHDMTITQQELGRRLRTAREMCGLTQDQSGEQVSLSRSAVAQIELGNRAVNSLELNKLARLYGREIGDFLAAEFQVENALIALFRISHDIADHPEAADALRHCMEVGRELTNLERLVGLDRDLTALVRYGLPAPRSRYDAIMQGGAVAEQERRRLGLADAAIESMPDLLEQQGVRTALVDLPEDVSGLTVVDREVGPFVAVSQGEHVMRRTFSFAHEYAHVLLDCDSNGIISRGRDRAELVEVRANAFAANLLLPEAGVRQFLATLGKVGEAKLLVETPTTQDDAIAMEGRGEPGAFDIQLHEIALLAHHFGVSRTVAIYRVRNLHLISDRELKRLLDEEKAGRGRELAHLLEIPEPDHVKERNRFRHRFLSLALEAFRREEISRAKLEELFGVLGRPKPDIPFDMFESLEGDKPTGVEIPE